LEVLKPQKNADHARDEEDVKESHFSDPLDPALFRVIRVPLGFSRLQDSLAAPPSKIRRPVKNWSPRLQ
jgi:hypothetical protein